MIYVGLFEATGIMARPWAEAGHRCIILDSQNDDTWCNGVYRARCDLSEPGLARAVIAAFRGGAGVAFVAAFPPCDHLAVSGARWFAGKGLRSLQQAVGYFATAAEICAELGAPYLIENPVSTMATYWRKPDHVFHTYTKTTCLWTGHGFTMPEPCPLDGIEPDDRIHRMAPGPGRKAARSATPLGFARAVYAANALVTDTTKEAAE